VDDDDEGRWVVQFGDDEKSPAGCALVLLGVLTFSVLAWWFILWDLDTFLRWSFAVLGG